MTRVNGLLVHNSAWGDAVGRAYFYTNPVEAQAKCDQLTREDEAWKISYVNMELHENSTVIWSK